jgi:hypothetical protein
MKEKKMEDVCSICLDDYSNNRIILECNHCLHRDCLKQLINSNNEKKCPLCRQDITSNFINNIFNKDLYTCSLCDKEICQDENDMDNVRLMKCGCNFHFNCWKKHLEKQFVFEKDNDNIVPFNTLINCPCCDEEQHFYNVNAREYSYLYNGHTTWIGQIENCKHKYCIYDGNPIRYGYCQLHAKHKSSNKAIKNTLRFMVKMGSFWTYEKKNRLFYKILRELDRNSNFGINLDIDILRFAESLEN